MVSHNQATQLASQFLWAPALLGIAEDSTDICNSTAVGPDTEAHEFRSS